MRIARAAALLALAGTVVACAGRAPYNAFFTPRADIRAKTKTVAVDRVTATEEVTDPQEVIARYGSIITAQLRVAGFVVIPPEASEAIRKRIADSLGTVYGQEPDRLNYARQADVRTQTMRELREHFGADAWLHARIARHNADAGLRLATWDGVQESFRPPLGLVRLFVDGVLHGPCAPENDVTVAPAFSLEVDLEDTQGAAEYRSYGGIQLYARPDYHGQLVAVPRNELFADPSRDRRAVRIALAALLGQTGRQEIASDPTRSRSAYASETGNR